MICRTDYSKGVIHQMRDAIDRTIGVMDETSVIIACSELGRIGEVNESVNAETMASTDTFVLNGYTYKSFWQPSQTGVCRICIRYR